MSLLTVTRSMNYQPVTDAKGHFLQVGQHVVHARTKHPYGAIKSFGPNFVRTQSEDGRCSTGRPTRLLVVRG